MYLVLAGLMVWAAIDFVMLGGVLGLWPLILAALNVVAARGIYVGVRLRRIAVWSFAFGIAFFAAGLSDLRATYTPLWIALGVAMCCAAAVTFMDAPKSN
jgi:hypothetical protein